MTVADLHGLDASLPEMRVCVGIDDLSGHMYNGRVVFSGFLATSSSMVVGMSGDVKKPLMVPV